MKIPTLAPLIPSLDTAQHDSCVFLVSYVGERSWQPIQSPNKGRKKKVEGSEEREIRSSLLIVDLKDGKLYDSGKQEGGKMFHKLHALGMNNDLWD